MAVTRVEPSQMEIGAPPPGGDLSCRTRLREIMKLVREVRQSASGFVSGSKDVESGKKGRQTGHHACSREMEQYTVPWRYKHWVG